jgi:hypothetical protein
VITDAPVAPISVGSWVNLAHVTLSIGAPDRGDRRGATTAQLQLRDFCRSGCVHQEVIQQPRELATKNDNCDEMIRRLGCAITVKFNSAFEKLLESALARCLVRTPAQELRAVAEAVATDMIEAYFNHQFRP